VACTHSCSNKCVPPIMRFCDCMCVHLEGVKALYSDEDVPQMLLCWGRRPVTVVKRSNWTVFRAARERKKTKRSAKVELIRYDCSPHRYVARNTTDEAPRPSSGPRFRSPRAIPVNPPRAFSRKSRRTRLPSSLSAIVGRLSDVDPSRRSEVELRSRTPGCASRRIAFELLFVLLPKSMPNIMR
jgi:hypothetical protein